MRQHTGAARTARIAVRLSSEEQYQIVAAAKTRGYANPSAFIRAAIRNELKGANGVDRHRGADCRRL
jgi:Arc/MetJ-type ribon-helix-helix transcriptional regulator